MEARMDFRPWVDVLPTVHCSEKLHQAFLSTHTHTLSSLLMVVILIHTPLSSGQYPL